MVTQHLTLMKSENIRYFWQICVQGAPGKQPDEPIDAQQLV